MTPAAAAVDHLIIGAGDLDAGIDWLEKRIGVRPVAGGSHPGRGTRNALLALSGRQYIEVLAPDPAQGEPRADLRALTEPKMIGWAAAADDIAGIARRLKSAGISSAGTRPGARTRPDGRQLSWTTLAPAMEFAEALFDPIPFFIQWTAGSAHPSQDSPRAGELRSLEFEHSRADELRRALQRIGVDAVVRAGTPRIVVTLNTPRGRVTLA
jgi:hypothetical protein